MMVDEAWWLRATDVRTKIMNGDHDELRLLVLKWGCFETVRIVGGGIWVEGPCAGYWLSDSAVIEFWAWTHAEV